MLIPCSARFVDVLGDRAAAEGLLGLAIPMEWPDDELTPLLRRYGAELRGDPGLLGYGPWAVGTRDARVVVGSAGFQGRPSARSEIELGFGIVPEHRGRGYATEAAVALIAWGLEQEGVARIVARCDPSNAASIRVLEKAGMKRRGAEGGMLRWAR